MKAKRKEVSVRGQWGTETPISCIASVDVIATPLRQHEYGGVNKNIQWSNVRFDMTDFFPTSHELRHERDRPATIQEIRMDDSGTHPNWDDFQARWLDYAQRVKEQWPEISFSDILATQGSRDHLRQRVAETYGLQEHEADRAVTIWQHAQIEPPQLDEIAAESPAA